jgi:hypothetical protein
MKMEKCKICKKEQEYKVEGNIIQNKWFCCWTCIEKAIEKGIIQKDDITSITRMRRSFLR